MSAEPNKQEPKTLGRQTRDKFKALVVTVGVSAAGLFMLSSPLILLKQCLDWLKTGVWHSFTIGMALDWAGIERPRTGWVGVQPIYEYVMASEYWWAMPPLATVVFYMIKFLYENRNS
jgi:hypothetical protein